MHKIIGKKFYLGLEFGLLINKKWITNSELLHSTTDAAGTSPFLQLDDAPRVAAGHLLKYKCTSWAEEQKIKGTQQYNHRIK
jgi:hypothetical protein